MSYSVSAVFNYNSTRIARLEGADVTRVKFDTNSVMLDEVTREVYCEVEHQRMYNGRDYNAIPSHTVITAYPTLSFEKR